MSYELYVFWFTVKQAALSTLFTIPLGVLIARAIVWNNTYKPAQICLKILGLPLITPALVGILGFMSLASPFFNIYSLLGIIAVHVVVYSPFVALFMINAWRFIPEEHYRLSIQLHFSSVHVFKFVEVPQLRKPLLEISWVCFCLFLNSFTTIMILGGGPQKTTLSVALYQSFFFFYDSKQGVNFASVQLLLTLSLAIFTIVFKVLPVGSSLKAPAFPNLSAPFQKPIIWLAGMLVFLPLSVVIVPSLMILPQTLCNPLLWKSFLKSLSLSLFIGPISVILTLCLVRYETLFTKPLASLYLLVPPAFISTLLFIFSLKFPQLSPEVFLIIIQLFIILPFSFRLLRGPYTSLQAIYRPTAISLGLSQWQRFHLIEGPLLKKPLATILGLGCALSLGDFQSLAFFESPEIPGLSHLLYQQMVRQFDEGMGTAFILLFLCFFLYQLPSWILRIYDRTLPA